MTYDNQQWNMFLWWNCCLSTWKCSRLMEIISTTLFEFFRWSRVAGQQINLIIKRSSNIFGRLSCQVRDFMIPTSQHTYSRLKSYKSDLVNLDQSIEDLGPSLAHIMIQIQQRLLGVMVGIYATHFLGISGQLQGVVLTGLRIFISRQHTWVIFNWLAYTWI